MEQEKKSIISLVKLRFFFNMKYIKNQYVKKFVSKKQNVNAIKKNAN